MSRFVHSLQAVALAWGAPGIALVAFLDSSVLSLPEIADLLVIWMVTMHPARFALYVEQRHDRVAARMSHVVLHRQGRRDPGEEPRQHAPVRQDAERVPPPRRDGGARAGAVAAAGAVQAVRPAGRHRRDQRREVRDGDSDRARRAVLSSRACWRCGMATGRSPISANTGSRWRRRRSSSSSPDSSSICGGPAPGTRRDPNR